MAIQHRRGLYNRFDPTKLLAGEWAVVLQDDPSSPDGKAAYVCFGAGDVKRVAVYEDLLDWFAGIEADTIDDVVFEAMADIRAEYETIKAEMHAAESGRVSAESAREEAEDVRISAEDARVAAENLRIAAELERQALTADLEEKRDTGYWDGATYKPAVNGDGILSWTNDKGKPNPESVSIMGPKGNDGVVTALDAGMYALQIEGSNLMLIYGDDATAPDLEIIDGDLILNVEGA